MEENKSNVQTVEAKKEQAENILKQRKQKNIKIYPIYRMFTWDLLFYYSIIYLFLTIEKGLTPAEALQFDAFYILFRSIVQIPCTLLIQRIGKRKSIIVANIILIIHIVIIMASRNFIDLLMSQLLCAFAYNIKSVCETDMLYDSLEDGKERGVKFAKIDGRAMSYYYYIDAVTAIIASFTFVINPYIPMILCMAIMIIAFDISLKFQNVQLRKEKYTIKKELKSIRTSVKNVFKSKRLRGLLIFNVIFIGMIRIMQTTRNTILTTIGLEEQYFGIIFAVLGIISGIAAKNQGKIHKKYRNRTLTFLSVPMAASMFLLGIILLFNINKNIILPIILLLFAIQYIAKGPYYVLIKQYLNNFTNSEKRIKITTANNLFENLFVSIILFISAFILDRATIDYSMITIGGIVMLAIIWCLEYMKKRVGKPMEQYTKKDLL